MSLNKLTLPEPKDFPILVTDAQTTAGLACLRSLSQASYKVHVIGEEPNMLCFHSKYAKDQHLCPSYSDSGFADWVLDFVNTHEIRLVLPTERFLISLGDRLKEILPLLHAQVSLETLKISLSKTRLFESFQNSSDPLLKDRLPRFKVLNLDNAFKGASEIEDLETYHKPYFVKCDALESPNGSPSQVFRCDDKDQLDRRLKQLPKKYSKVLVQEYAPGQGAGVFLLQWKQETVAEFQHRRIHEVPHTGGYSSLRAAIRNDELLEDARRRALDLGWQGPAMFEYRLDPVDQRFRLMELNARFWGSLHLSLYAGVDFPKMLADLARGVKVENQKGYDLSTVARLSVPGEIQHLVSVLKDRQVALTTKLSKLAQFFWLFFDPRVRDDLFYPGDRFVYFYELRRYVGVLLNRLSRRGRRRIES